MSFLKFIITTTFIFLSWIISFYFVYNFMSPNEFWNTAIILFYLTVFISSISLFLLLWLFMRYLFSNKFYLKFFFLNSLRQAFFLSSILCISFYFMSINAFSYLNLFLLILTWFFIETFYFYLKNNNND